MKCYYEVLELARDADASEIKVAYRKLALKWHPDKNLDNSDEAKEQFQLVQNAYEVLSDPQERAWYDNHREQLLKGAGSSFSDESLNLIQYFTASCFKGFGDDDKGFYSVYREVFKKLAAEEVDYLDDPEDVNKIPTFGLSDTNYEKVHEFYSYWMSFTTMKTYVWLDKYDIREVDNRKVLKMLEKENQKIRQKARKERNEEIRQLVSFIRKRDKRVLAHSRLLEKKAKENKEKLEKTRKEKLIQRQLDLEKAKKELNDVGVYNMNNFNEKLEEIEKHLFEEFGESEKESSFYSSDDETEDISHDVKEAGTKFENTKNNQEQSNFHLKNLYCMACNKLFKNLKSFENHENSKKHKENVLNLNVSVEISEDEEIDKPTETASCSTDDALLQNENNKHKNKKKKVKKVITLDESDDEITSSYLSNLESGSRNRRGRRTKQSNAAMNNKAPKLQTNETHDTSDAPEISNHSNNLIENKELETETLEIDVDNLTENTKNDKSKRSKNNMKPKEKKIINKQKTDNSCNVDSSNIDTSHCCVVCKNNFSSKNKLFDHLKKSGHQVYIPSVTNESDKNKVKKVKGKHK